MNHEQASPYVTIHISMSPKEAQAIMEWTAKFGGEPENVIEQFAKAVNTAINEVLPRVL